MLVMQRRVRQFAPVLGVAIVATAFMPATPSPSPAPIAGMTFRLKVVLKHTPTSGRQPRAVTLIGHGQFAAGVGRVNIDTVDAPSAIRKGDVFIIHDSTRTFWARPSNMTVRQMNAPLVNPLEGISERITSGTGSPRSLRAVFDTVSLDEMVNELPTRHFRITADVVYPVGDRQVTQKVVIDQWLAKTPLQIMNPFGSRVRGLPAIPMVNGAYREFVRTLNAANRVYGNAVTIRTATTTSYVYGPGLGEDYYQTVDLTDLQQADIDEKLFQLSADFKLQQVARDTEQPKAVAPRKPPAR
ncbi:MAG: hypothetical protein ABIR92_05920 [Gemmatimonadaceae bacterium]